VEVAAVTRRSISSFIETNGTLEAENEVDIVARVTAPVIELHVEEGMEVRAGQILAQLDGSEIKSRAEISRVNLKDAEQAYERAKTLRESQLVSSEEFEQAQTRVETARAQYESDRIQLGYTEIKAPFAGLVISRYIDLAEQANPGTQLFRISDFTPLLCPIQVPERDLPKLRLGQRAYLTFEAWPGERFAADVLRIRPVVDAATGTVRVTLDVDAMGRLRPGMFARVYVETEMRENTLVIPKAALSLESIGDTVYVASESAASRRSVTLGFREGDSVEVLAGVEEGEQVIVVGQDGLSEGTPINVLAADGVQVAHAPAGTQGPGDVPRGPDGRPDFSKMTPEQLERARESMRARGMTDEQIEERLQRAGSGRTDESQ
jgi:RND family efflux transporter MFP subunit